ncbi:MAG TPA: BTAD domain-containing putative transcriptional regulator [Gemmatimonadales bacterium]|nr:BTAD domain-containing putative transcriptional regulator [Gemmatimonadales bacterium]
MIRFRTLGTVDLRGTDGTELRTILAQPKRVALLAYLTLARPRGFHRRDTLVGLFWPESDQERARNALRQAAHFLRQPLGGDVLVSRGMEDLGIDASKLWCDAIAFEAALDRGEAEAGLEIYGGDLLRGFFVAGAPEFERWLDAERSRLRDRATRAAWTLADCAAAENQTAPAAHWARWAAALHPEDEIGQRRLIEVLLRLGDRRSALKAYADFAERLRAEFDAEPSAETRALVERTRTSPTPPPAPATTPPTAAPSATPARALEKIAAVPRLSRRGWWAAVAVMVIGTIGGVIAIRQAHTRRAVETLAPAVAVLPFTVRGQPEVAYLREGLVDLIAAGIDGAGHLRVIDPNAVLAQAAGRAPLDPEAGADIARRLGAAYFVLGDAVEIAGRLQLTAGMYTVSRPTEPLAKARAEGEANDVFRLTSRAAGQLLVGAVPGADTSFMRLAGVSTPSTEAFRAYIDGEAALRAGHYEQAVDGFQRSVAADPLFALAYYRLAVAADWVGNAPLLQRGAAAAVRLGDRLSPLTRSMLAGFQAYSVSLGDSAERIYHAVVAAHPDNLEARYMLGEVHFHYNSYRGRPFTEARGDFEHVLRIDADHPHALIHLARIAAAEGNREELNDLVNRFLALRPDADRALEMQALRAFAMQGVREQDRIVEELRGASDVVLLQIYQSVAALTEDPAGAARISALFDVPTRDLPFRLLSRANRARLGAARGRWADAYEHLQALEHRAPDWGLMQHALLAATPLLPVPEGDLRQVRDRLRRWKLQTPDFDGHAGNAVVLMPPLRLYLLGLIAAKIDEPTRGTKLQNLSAELDSLADREPIIGFAVISHDAAHSLRASAAGLRGQPGLGLREIEQMNGEYALLSRNLPETEGWVRFLHAELLHQMGRDDEALQLYASFPSPSAHDIAFLGPALYRQAQILEKRGEGVRAAQRYRRFVLLWEDCDPPLVPMLDSARAALARLGQPAAPR